MKLDTKPFDIIFNKLYRCNVPIISTYTSRELEFVDIPTDIRNGEVVDSKMENVVVEITVTRMVDIFMNGFRIGILNKDDISEIYYGIQDHIANFSSTFKSSPNEYIDVPVDDLENLDLFASSIFKNQKKVIVEDSIPKQNAFGIGTTPMAYANVKKEELNYDELDHVTQVPKRRKRKYSLDNLLKG